MITSDSELLTSLITSHRLIFEYQLIGVYLVMFMCANLSEGAYDNACV